MLAKSNSLNETVVIRMVNAVEKIRQDYAGRMEAMDVTATGKTAGSMFITSDNNSASLFGRPYFFSIETGRGPSGSGSGEGQPGGLKMAILEWINARGIKPNDPHLVSRTGSERHKMLSLAHIISRKIHKDGTRLFRAGVRRDVITGINLEGHIGELRKQITNDIALSIYQTISVGAKKGVTIKTTNITF